MNKPPSAYRIFPLGDSALTIDFGNIIDEEINKEVIARFNELLKEPIPGMVEAVPAYSSLTIYYDALVVKKFSGNNSTAFGWILQQVENKLKQAVHYDKLQHRKIKIPVCYERDFAPDIQSLAIEKNITIDEVIAIHTSVIYPVYMLGFLPGFPYLGGVDERIAMPRKAKPQNVPAGSVGIAARQTGIYPLTSPGGWHIIGRTPLQLFDANKKEPTLLKMGDLVQFYAIAPKGFYEIQNAGLGNEGGICAMNNIRIIKAGVLDTMQDLGRYGSQQLGINPGGAMDRWSVEAANILVGNKKEAAVIELHFPASDFFFEKPVLLAISGADFSPYINGEEVPCHQPVLVNRYSILQFRGIKNGARAYLSVHGGFDMPQWLGSYSTNIKAAAGGYKGRSLQKDDEIIIPSLPGGFLEILDKKEFIILPWKADIMRNEDNKTDIFMLPGNEWDRLDGHSKENFLHHPFTISQNSDRMGYLLQGDKLIVTENEEIVSSSVSFGTVQLLPDGQLIILMADHQTTGGYPRVAHIISAHHSRLAQMRVGEKVYFSLANQQKAEELLLKDQQHLLQLQNACTFRLQQYLNANRF